MKIIHVFSRTILSSNNKVMNRNESICESTGVCEKSGNCSIRGFTSKEEIKQANMDSNNKNE